MSRETPYPWLPVSPHTLAGVTSPGEAEGVGAPPAGGPTGALMGRRHRCLEGTEGYLRTLRLLPSHSRVSAGVEEAEVCGMHQRDRTTSAVALDEACLVEGGDDGPGGVTRFGRTSFN